MKLRQARTRAKQSKAAEESEDENENNIFQRRPHFSKRLGDLYQPINTIPRKMRIAKQIARQPLQRSDQH